MSQMNLLIQNYFCIQTIKDLLYFSFSLLLIEIGKFIYLKFGLIISNYSSSCLSHLQIVKLICLIYLRKIAAINLVKFNFQMAPSKFYSKSLAHCLFPFDETFLLPCQIIVVQLLSYLQLRLNTLQFFNHLYFNSFKYLFL